MPESAPGIHGAGVKLDIVRVPETERLDTGVCGSDLMVQAALEYRDATEHEVSLRRAFYRTRVVNIEDVHWRAGTAKRPSGGTPPTDRAKRSPPSR